MFCFLLATSGSDSPGQAVEAEEIVKQLDMEQLEETPTSTTTDSSRDITFDSALNPRPLLPTDAAEEEGEIVTEADMPPLTGAERNHLFHICIIITIIEDKLQFMSKIPLISFIYFFS